MAPRGSQPLPATPPSVICPACAKVLEGEPNFCLACGADLRGLSGSSDTLDGAARQTIDGRYRVLEKLGEGGMGAVYKVEHVRMGKIAALKLLRPDHALDQGLKARFLQEARVVARLSHPSTVQVFDSGELDDGSLFIAMEFIPGKDLAWQLKAHGPLPQEKAISIGIQILDSLQEAHEAGIIHRDIKPANVMLVRGRKPGAGDQVKLLDFGIAKLQEAEGRKSVTGDFVGTPAYMSPEQIRGEAVDGRSDLYSLGALLFELVSGRQLFVGPTPISILTQHAATPAPRVLEVAAGAPVSPAFEAVLQRALEKDPARRFPDAEAMRQALEALHDRRAHAPVEFTPVPAERPERMLSREDYEGFERRLRLQRTLAPLLALALVAGLGVAGWRLLLDRPLPGLSDHELEPDDVPAQATRFALGQPVTGAIGASATDDGDRDLYQVEVPGGRVRVLLSGVPDLNLTLELLQKDPGGRWKRLVFLDEVGVGGGERLEALATRAGPLLLRVEERPFCTEPNRPPREKALVPYQLQVDAMPAADGLELEPNDTPGTAQALSSARALTGFLGERLDDVERTGVVRPDAPFSSPDHYRVEVTEGRSSWLVVVPPERGAVQVAVLDDAELRRGRPLEVRAAPAFLELRSGPRGRKVRLLAGRDSLPGDSYQLAVADLGEHGLDAVLELAELLRAQGREASRRLVLEGAAQRLAASPQAGRLAP